MAIRKTVLRRMSLRESNSPRRTNKARHVKDNLLQKSFLHFACYFKKFEHGFTISLTTTQSSIKLKIRVGNIRHCDSSLYILTQWVPGLDWRGQWRKKQWMRYPLSPEMHHLGHRRSQQNRERSVCCHWILLKVRYNLPLRRRLIGWSKVTVLSGGSYSDNLRVIPPTLGLRRCWIILSTAYVLRAKRVLMQLRLCLISNESNQMFEESSGTRLSLTNTNAISHSKYCHGNWCKLRHYFNTT